MDHCATYLARKKINNLIVDLNSYVDGLLGNIEPSTTAVKNAKRAHEELRERLEKDEQISQANPETYLTGSYARNTALKTIKDVDVILLIDLNHNETEPEVVVRWLEDALLRHYKNVRPQGRSVNVTTDSGFDLDVVPSVPFSDSESPVWIPDRDVQLWVETHPKGQIEFGVKRNKSTDGYYKHLVKIFKHWRDRLSSEASRPKSYVLECLVAESLTLTPPSYAFAVVGILSHIYETYSQYLKSGVVPNISDPGYARVNVAKRWTFGEFSAFLDAVLTARDIARTAYESDNKEKTIALWRQLFGEQFRPRD